jgi:putative two-component system response regulator
LDNNEFLARAKNMLDLHQTRKKLADRATWLKEEVDKATVEIAERNREILLRERETIICLAKAAEYRDPETGAHILRMAHYSKHIARYMGESTEQQDILLDAAPMHDVGKVGIADLILLKPGKLNETEFAIMREHAYIGYKILNESTSEILKVAAEIAWTHHEKFDGTGYPRQLIKDAIPIFGRIVAVADVFDALTSERPYKKGWSVEDAAQFVKDNSGSHFDPACVEAFFTEFDEVLAIKNKFIDDNLEPRNRLTE